MTTVISIGNTDNKLTQQEWSFFVYSVEHIIRRHTRNIYFVGGSGSFSSYQNAAFIFDMEDKPKKLFRRSLRRLLRKFGQDSAAWLEAPTEFVPPAPPEEGQSTPATEESPVQLWTFELAELTEAVADVTKSEPHMSRVQEHVVPVVQRLIEARR